MVYFTCDTHIGHDYIPRLDNRPFRNVEKMDTEIIRRWNNKVKPSDTVYIIGDFIWKRKKDEEVVSILNALNGKKHLIVGNHDNTILRSEKSKAFFSSISDMGDISIGIRGIGTKRVIMSHYFMPFYEGSKKGTILLYGHSHNREEYKIEKEIIRDLRKSGYSCNAYNVGCMHWNYEPVSLNEIINREGYVFDISSPEKQIITKQK